MPNETFSDDPKNPWAGVSINLVALHSIVCQVLGESATQCGPPVAIGLGQQANYARVYSFKLPTRTVVARLVSPVKPLFKTESEVAAMDFVRCRTALPVPKVFAYCSEASNPVGTEWLIMEHMPGVAMGDAWDNLEASQKRRLALDLVDLYDQLFWLKADGCGGIYHSVNSVDDRDVLPKSRSAVSETKHRRSPRWAPLSPKSLLLLRSHCAHSIHDSYRLGPLHDISLINFKIMIPSPSQTRPVFTSDEYVKLVAYNGNPPTRMYYDLPSREKCVELFQSIYNFYPNSTALGPSADSSNFRFSHGDLHDGNILIDPRSGAITGIIDWEAAAFRPLWSDVNGVGWFEEDHQRFIFGADDPENFDDDINPEDAELRAFFRSELHKKNPDLFSCFLGGIELRAVLSAAGDWPRPVGTTDAFLNRYHELGIWNEDRRGAFPWDIKAWERRRADLDQLEMLHNKQVSHRAPQNFSTGVL